MNQKKSKKEKKRPFSDFGRQLKAWQRTQEPDDLVEASVSGPKGKGSSGERGEVGDTQDEIHTIQTSVELSDSDLFSQAVDAISDSSSAILQKYSREDHSTRPAEGSPPSAPNAQASKQIADRALFLQAVGDLNPADVNRAKPQVKQETEKSGARFRVRVQRGDFHPHASIDLHGDSRETAEKRLRTFLAAEQNKRSEIVLVVHGKGLGILANEVRDVLDAEPSVAEHVPAPSAWGGEGARVVRLKNRRARVTE